jgi:broad specificity phosphatase PhoE
VRNSCKTGKVLGLVDMEAVRSALGEGGRVTLLMRHAERPPLDPSDTSFGETLPITDHGRVTAERFGVTLADVATPDTVKFYASQTFRTIQTACAVSKGLGAVTGGSTSCHDVCVDDVLGGDTPFFGALDERMALIAEGRYMERLNEYYRTGTQKGYKPLGPATEAMEHALDRLHRGRSGLVVAVTHDINVASFLAGRGVVAEYDNATWPHYLDAAVLVDDCAGGVGYGVLRHSQIPRNDGA